MASFSVELPDLSELQRKLKGVPAALAKKVLRQALRSGAKVIQKKARALAPVDTGITKKAIKVRAGKRSRKPRIWINTIVGDGDYKGETFYAAFVEYGHKLGKRRGKLFTKLFGDKRKEVPPRPFMRPAAEQSQDEALKVVREAIASGIERGGAKAK